MKKGSPTTISCVITGITDTATVTWRTSTGEVSGDEFTVNQGSHSKGTQTSTLAVNGTQVNVDTAYTCRVISGRYPASGQFDTTVNLVIDSKLDTAYCKVSNLTNALSEFIYFSIFIRHS